MPGTVTSYHPTNPNSRSSDSEIDVLSNVNPSTQSVALDESEYLDLFVNTPSESDPTPNLYNPIAPPWRRDYIHDKRYRQIPIETVYTHYIDACLTQKGFGQNTNPDDLNRNRLEDYKFCYSYSIAQTRRIKEQRYQHYERPDPKIEEGELDKLHSVFEEVLGPDWREQETPEPPRDPYELAWIHRQCNHAPIRVQG